MTNKHYRKYDSSKKPVHFDNNYGKNRDYSNWPAYVGTVHADLVDPNEYPFKLKRDSNKSD